MLRRVAGMRRPGVPGTGPGHGRYEETPGRVAPGRVAPGRI